MIDHVSIGVADLETAGAFYDSVLTPLEYDRYLDRSDAIGYRSRSRPGKFFLNLESEARAPSPGMHIAFAAPSREAVDEFHRVALEAGGEDDGEPGLRPKYSDGYYGAFVVDPHGYRIEAVNRDPD